MPNAIGIDLGISYVSIAVVQDGNVHIIPDIHGRKRIPSPYLLRTPVTHDINPANVNPVCRALCYSKEDARVILAAAKALAESYVGTTVDDAVITVPLFYNDMERVETRDVHQLLNTPMAAAIAQWADFPMFDAHLMLVLDIGARGAESTILDVCNSLFEVKSSQGDCQLGGYLYDFKLCCYLEYHTRDQIQGGDLESLLSRTEGLKRSLSICELISDASGVVLMRKEYENVCKSNFTVIIDLMKRTLHITKVEKSDIQEVVFVGGTASILILQKILADFFGCSRRDLYSLQAVSLTDCVLFSELLILDVVPGLIYIELLPGFLLQLWPRNTILTCESSIIIEALSPEYLPRFVKLIEGDSRSVRTLGIFDLWCLQLSSDCQATIEIKVSIDLDGIVDAVVALRHLESGITIPLQRLPVADNQPNMDDDTKLIQPSESPSTALLESYISFLQLIAPKLSTECQDTLRARAMALEYLIRTADRLINNQTVPHFNIPD
ncbi:hypothetical protein ASPFODRAFT_57429 [Aspergillus luchuensis CBS 106.47]|uniref:Uncharacterized protein n=1 Tax=Aspergillus luchuensis (strain CBS 106.47) TaxID=1137211 RepID=A0A1M3TX78_ASPLC|nr:hypothetical protein ASPFODRAFT_57429 [Aspergillus luchuensis CBS 106.47]